MPIPYRLLSAHGARCLRVQIRTGRILLAKNNLLARNMHSTQSSRPLHTTPSLSAAASLQQQDDDDENSDLAALTDSILGELGDVGGGVASQTDVSSWNGELSTSASPWDAPWDANLWESSKDKATEQDPSPTHPLTNEEIIDAFDPSSPPPSSLKEMQLWLECQSQQESILKFQQVLESTRSRQEYASMGMIQKQILEWFEPLKKAYGEEQLRYLTSLDKKVSMYKYGPHLCVLMPEKLALLAAQEAISFCLQNTGGSLDGVTFTKLALHLGQVVEAELNVQRLIERQVMEEREKRGDQTLFEKDDYENDDDDDLLEEEEFDDEDGVPPSQDDGLLFTNSISTWMYTAAHLEKFRDEIFNKTKMGGKKRLRVAHALKMARQRLGNTEPWTAAAKAQLGAALLEPLLEICTVLNKDGKHEPAFKHKTVWRDAKTQGVVSIHVDFYNKAVKDSLDSKRPISSRYRPMVIPPKPWTGPTNGGYTWLKTVCMRTRASKMQEEALRGSDLSLIYDGLNALGKVPWVINTKVLDVAKECWRTNISLGDIPTQTNVVVPPAPDEKERIAYSVFKDKTTDEFKAACEKLNERKALLGKYRRAVRQNMDLRSLRCSAILKLDQADQFRDFEEIYFPYNMDFRGRAYPIPPHLSNVGSDLCRGLLKFAKSKPLGDRGMYWLKVHLANLAGNDKITFDERAAFTEENMDNVRAAVNDPLGENRWWMSLEDPFQGLAACHEICNAIDSGDPTTYETAVSVHMDGSCNGLQHYAALGLDVVGGTSVNLTPTDKPQDVYSGVKDEVAKRVAEEAAIDLDFDDKEWGDLSTEEKNRQRKNKAAKLVNGLIDRGVVKRTVMTSVYGVTFIGARNQIQEKIEEKLKAKGVETDLIDVEIRRACAYLAKMTLDVMGELFTGARETMSWLNACARLISRQEHPVSWITPLGLPVIQPYRQTKKHHIVTLVQTLLLVDQRDDLPVHKMRQASAFPPNYIHSLDSTHMFLTALEMEKRGLTFSAVHDSFWTHPCDIDEMNEVLRDSFVELYEQPLLENLKETWALRYPSIEFPDIPEKGELDLNDVKSAPYFFQ